MQKDIKEVFLRIKKNNYIERIIMLTVSMFISALIFNFFQKKVNLVTGGSSGVALILHELFNLSTSDVITVIMITFLLLSFIFLGFEMTSGTIISSILYPFFIKITENWPELISVDTSDLLLISIFMGIAYGITNGIVYKNGFSNGGPSVLSQILYKYQRISIATSSFIINMVIVVLGGIFFGFDMVMYASIILYINKLVTNKIIVGTSKNKVIYIITAKTNQVSSFIMNDLSKGVTELSAYGGLKNKKRPVLMTVINNSDYFRLKEGIQYIDNKAFLIVTDTYQTKGGK